MVADGSSWSRWVSMIDERRPQSSSLVIGGMNDGGEANWEEEEKLVAELAS